MENAGRIGEVLGEYALPTVGAVFAIALLVWAILRIRAWYREDTDPADDAKQLLSQIELLRRQGDVSEAEFRSIKGRLVQRMINHNSSDVTKSSGTPRA